MSNIKLPLATATPKLKDQYGCSLNVSGRYDYTAQGTLDNVGNRFIT